MTIQFIKSSEKKEIIAKLNSMFGIEEIPHLLIKSGREKIRAYSGSLSKDELAKLSEFARIEVMGLYFINMNEDGDIRLTIDAIHRLKDQIKTNIAELNDEQFHAWIRGNNIEMSLERGTYVIKYKGDFIGTGKSNGTTLFNYIPKDRRLKK